jgi:hypothetical protein
MATFSRAKSDSHVLKLAWIPMQKKNLTNLIVFDAFSAKISDSTQFFCFIHIPFPTQLDV